MAKFSVLIADDSRSVRSLVKTALHGIGTEIAVLEAEDGQRAVEYYRQYRSDLVLMDITMPVLDGLGALKAIKAIDPAAFVVMLTADSGQDTVLKAKDLKADGYVAKPFQGGRIIELVRSRMAVAKETISVLIAEDSGGIRSILRRAFATLPHRFQLREASDGQQAIDMFETRPADLVFLDIHMPNKSGIEALEHIRRLAPDVWIIMCTSDASADSINDAKAFRANDFLLKPFTPTQFSQMVQRFFDRRR